MCSLVSQHNLFTLNATINRGLVNVFIGTQATPEQSCDLLNARKIGQQGYINYITHNILRFSSVTNPPVRRKQLLTMAPPKATKRRLSQKEKEERNTIKHLRRRLAWCNQTGQRYDESEEQYSTLPRALTEIDGSPHKGSKSKWTDKLQARYNTPNTTPFMSTPEWIPEVAILDAMFAINTNPLRQHKTLEQYAYLLFRQYCVPHYQHGTNEVHLVFDHPGRVDFNPKECEHKRRYSRGSSTAKEHAHVTFTPQSTIPRPWREYLDCRQCKRSLVEALGWVYLRTATHHFKDGQVLVLAGCFSGERQDDAWVLTGGSSIPEPTHMYTSNALEADMRVWRHATQTQFQKILVY